MGPPVVCDVNLGEMLGPRIAALEEGCTSEDEVGLEVDGGEQGDRWTDVEEEGPVAGPSKLPVKPYPQRRRWPTSVSSDGTISDISSGPDNPPKPLNHHRRYRKKCHLEERIEGDTARGAKGIWLQRKNEAVPVLLPNFDTSHFPTNSTGFAALPQPSFCSSYMLEELEGMGFTYVASLGKEACPLVDRARRVIGITHCIPQDEESWGKVVRGLERGVTDGISQLSFTKKQRVHKRGRFAALNVGVAYGGGCQVAGNVYLSSKARRFMRCLLCRRSFKRWSGFLNRTQPLLFSYTANT